MASWLVAQSGQTVTAGKSNSSSLTLSIVLVTAFSSQSLRKRESYIQWQQTHCGSMTAATQRLAITETKWAKEGGMKQESYHVNI